MRICFPSLFLIITRSCSLPPSRHTGYSHKKTIRELKPYLKPEDAEALVCATNIVLLEENGQHKIAGKVWKKLSKRYGDRGVKIYNLLRSDRFKEFAIFLQFCRMASKNRMKQIEMFQKYFDDILKYYPLAIWVNVRTGKERIKDKLNKRFVEGVPFVTIYGRGRENLQKIEKACIEYIEETNREDYILKREDYTIGKHEAGLFVVIRKKRIKQLMEPMEKNQ